MQPAPVCKYNIILDLDETLIHTIYTGLSDTMYSEDIVDHLKSQLDWFGYKDSVVFARPYLKEFLAFLFQHFNVGVMTLGTKNYAKRIVKHFFVKQGHTPIFVLSRKHVEKQEREMHGLKNLDYFFRHAGSTDFPRDIFKPCNTFIIDDNKAVHQSNVGRVIKAPAFDFEASNDAGNGSGRKRKLDTFDKAWLLEIGKTDTFLKDQLMPLLRNLITRYPDGCMCLTDLPIFSSIDLQSLMTS